MDAAYAVATHEVTNQPAPLADVDLFRLNLPMRDALARLAPGLDSSGLTKLGQSAGSVQMQVHARLANAHGPELHTHDRHGRRVDQVEFHPSYHALMATACEGGLHGTPWGEAASNPHAHLLRAAGFMLFSEVEPSHLCPVSMTYAATPALRGNAELAGQWAPKLFARAYDPAFRPFEQKAGVTMGMGMTEKQGGSDVRANTTQAVFHGETPWGRCFRLVGHKWFFSAPMCDAFLVLAQTPAGLSCFFLPRWLPEWLGEPDRVNRLRIQRLKDKLGNKANASSEVEFHGAYAWLIGEEGRGVAQILEMGTMTRLDCALGSSALMRQALSQALNHTAQRMAFGKPLIAQPLMRNVLADLALESEAATALALRLAHAFDHPEADRHAAAMRRLLTPVAKYWICKRGAGFAQEAMECLGGNGYVEEGGEGILARIYREMPVNSIWEGAGNIMALDLLRAAKRGSAHTSELVDALMHELQPARGMHAGLDACIASVAHRLTEGTEEIESRGLAQDLALAVQAALLRQQAPDFVFEAFCASRFGSPSGLAAFGCLPSRTHFDGILARAMPALN
ncbi:MAG: isovaleryl-CoA dehydrogenase [Aquabacterium sp.]|nr:MAG: isovaleryl-CoA dehydrogenase [Aquabacterium sp.]